jgi:hypothetical protein
MIETDVRHTRLVLLPAAAGYEHFPFRRIECIIATAIATSSAARRRRRERYAMTVTLSDIEALPNGARYYKADLHVHTPHDPERYERKGEVTAADITAGAKAAGVEIIAVTDHNTAAGVDEVKAAGEKGGVVVFPGVELTTSAHILNIFDRDVDGGTVRDFCRIAGIALDEIGMTLAVAEKSIIEILNMDYDRPRIAVAPHVLSRKGLFGIDSGQLRIRAYQAKTLLAVEVPEKSSNSKKCVESAKAVIPTTAPNAVP